MARPNASGLYPTVLENVRVLFDGIPGTMYFVTRDEVAAIVPYAMAGRNSVKVVVEYQGAVSREVDARVVDTSPGIFTQTATGLGAGVIQNADYSLNTPSNAVARGSYVIIYVTGEGALVPAARDGEQASLTVLRRPIASVDVRIDGQAAELIFAGAVPTLVHGVAQVVAYVPQAARPGAAIPVEVIIGGRPSQAGVTLSVR